MKRRKFLKARQRPLNPAEIRLLRLQSLSLRRRGRSAISWTSGFGLLVVIALWALTVLVSNSPPLLITAFWVVAGSVILFWTRRDLRADASSMNAVAAGLESALRRNLANVYEVRASAFVEFEEIEDEGACYAFQIAGDRIVFLHGQEFYEGARFPSLHFSLVLPLDGEGHAVDMLVESHARKAQPQRRVQARVKASLDLPEHLEIVPGSLDGLEDRLCLHDPRDA